LTKKVKMFTAVVTTVRICETTGYYDIMYFDCLFYEISQCENFHNLWCC